MSYHLRLDTKVTNPKQQASPESLCKATSIQPLLTVAWDPNHSSPITPIKDAHATPPLTHCHPGIVAPHHLKLQLA
ncbi:unnamed protein product [Arctogadus glacialis]